jgi:NAD-dependent dihydropyrimidine dehydrogenase PreA subunit
VATPLVIVRADLCKGCDYCVASCPEHCLVSSGEINAQGYRFAEYTGTGCTGCGICFYACPELGAITVYRPAARKGGAA